MIKIPVYKPHLLGNEKTYVNQCLDTTWISSRGAFVDKFEQLFATTIGARHAASVCNGTVALHLALEALGIKAGDEVIVPTLTYVASVNMIALTGAIPVFVDSLPDSWQMDPDDVRRKITPRTKAIMAVHLYGRPCAMRALKEICTAHKLFLVEDCAEAFGTTDEDGHHVGTQGDIATFSFFGNKTITTGEGGMVTTRDDATHQRLLRIKSQGVSPDREYWHDIFGYNYRMTNICAAIGVAQLEQADSILAKKRQIAVWYNSRLADLPLALDREPSGAKERHSYWMVCAVAEDKQRKEKIRTALKEAGVETRPFFHPAHTLPMYRHLGGAFPVAESLGARGMNLPSYPALAESEVDFVCGVIRHALTD